jgi:uncharacterized protein YuzE
MHIRSDRERNNAHLCLDEAGVVARRLTFAGDEEYAEVAGITLDFDAGGRLIGVGFEDAERHLPPLLFERGEGLRVRHDPEAGAAYLYLGETSSPGEAGDTLPFGDEDHEPAWGINFDLDRNGRVLGIEFERDYLAPPALLAQSEPLPPRWVIGGRDIDASWARPRTRNPSRSTSGTVPTAGCCDWRGATSEPSSQAAWRSGRHRD